MDIERRRVHGWGWYPSPPSPDPTKGGDALSGVITRGALLDGTSLVGGLVGARLRDNGATANDPADQISFTEIEPHGNYEACTEKPDYELFDAPQGQVKVR